MRKLLRALTVAGAFLVATVAAAAAQETTYMVEMIPLQPGATPEQAEAYFDAVSPIIAAHGVFPVQSYQVLDQERGAPVRVVNVWRVARPEGLPEIFADPRYVEHVRERDAIFDLRNRVGWMTRELY
jgi:hypothetical protein